MKAGVDTVLPSEAAWFRFDENPGAELILVFLNTEKGYSELGTRVAEPDLSATRTAELVSAVEKGKGSKDLMLEVEDQGTCFVNSGATRSPGSLALLSTEIVLNHQP